MRKDSNKKHTDMAKARINRVYSARCSGIQIPMMEVLKVWEVGMASCLLGDSDDVLGDKILAYVDTIRWN